VVMLIIMLFFYKLKESDVQAMIEANRLRDEAIASGKLDNEASVIGVIPSCDAEIPDDVSASK